MEPILLHTKVKISPKTKKELGCDRMKKKILLAVIGVAVCLSTMLGCIKYYQDAIHLAAAVADLEQKNASYQSTILAYETQINEQNQTINDLTYIKNEYAQKQQEEQETRQLSLSSRSQSRRRNTLEVISASSTKTYMDYRAITAKNSPQYKYIHNYMDIGEDGFLRDEDGYIGVALGSYFGEIGSRYDFVLDSGITLHLIKVEEKSDADTSYGFYHNCDGSVIEFVIDTKSAAMQKNRWNNGLIWSGNFNNCSEFKGRISSIWSISE